MDIKNLDKVYKLREQLQNIDKEIISLVVKP